MIRLIAAIDDKRGIAKNGTIPWHLPRDLEYFKQLTLSHGATLLMGRKTYESIGRPLPSRRNIVVSTQLLPEVETIKSLDILKHLKEAWVIGGASIYEQTIGIADELYMTQIKANFGCDQFFPRYREKFSCLESVGPYKQGDIEYYYERWIANKAKIT